MGEACRIQGSRAAGVRISHGFMRTHSARDSDRVGVPLQVQVEERRGLDRRIKNLEIRLSGALSSKALSDEEHAQRVKVPSC